jgi:hypothetical protein
VSSGGRFIATLLNRNFYFICIIQMGMGFLMVAETEVMLNEFKGLVTNLPLLLDEFLCSLIGRYAAGARQFQLLYDLLSVLMKLKNISHRREMAANHFGAG